MKKRNPNHVRRGRAGTWREALSEQQHRQVTAIAGRMLELLHYPMDKEASPLLPYASPHLDPEAVRRAVAQSRRTWAEEVKRVYVFLTSRRPLRAKVHRVRTWTQKKVQRLKDRWANAASL